MVSETKGWSFVGGHVKKQAVLRTWMWLPGFLALTQTHWHLLARELAADPEDSGPSFGGLPFACMRARPQGCDAGGQPLMPCLP